MNARRLTARRRSPFGAADVGARSDRNDEDKSNALLELD
jgi:hypothetical protein